MKTKAILIIFIALLAAWGFHFSRTDILKTADPEKQIASPAKGINTEEKKEVTPSSMKTAGIEVVAAGPSIIKMTLEFPGEIEFNRNKVAHIVPRVAGVVSEIRKNLGDKARKNEIIAILESQGLAETKSQYIQSVHRLEFAQASFIREESLWKKKISAEQDYLTSRHQLEEAELARQVAEQKLLSMGLSREDLSMLSIEPEGIVKDREVRTPFIHGLLTRYELRSPIDGTVVDKQVIVGEMVKEDTVIFNITDLSTVWGGISVYANNLNAVRIGQKVTVRTKDMETTGTISYLGPLIGQETRTAKAYVHIPNPKELWRAGLFITVEVVREEITVPVAVPTDAIQTLHNRSVVFVQHNDIFEAQTVELGRSDGKWTEIRSGLSPGELYASKNSFVLKAEMDKAANDR